METKGQQNKKSFRCHGVLLEGSQTPRSKRGMTRLRLEGKLDLKGQPAWDQGYICCASLVYNGITDGSISDSFEKACSGD